MESKLTTFFALLVCMGINMMHCESYYSESSSNHYTQELTEKESHLHFYYFDIHAGENASAVVVVMVLKTHHQQHHLEECGPLTTL
ncbi:hypothetical protein TanjilG_29694 [Lupinus angustifolius]|uniref:Dirigent protein n=1 Tax=Lupinus angustifolius TaxID=3871 RepID=A0A4P1R601_LUPAN|nr:hypothetical protein TanjilG_29694 [Lupinus angustifolius]